MKHTLTRIVTVVTLCSLSSITYAAANGKGHGKKGHNHREAKANKIAENAAAKEEAILAKKDANAWKKDPEARDHRHDNLREYTNHTYKRIVRLLTIGALEESDGTKFKTRHAAIIKGAKAANQNGLDEAEKKSIRSQMNTLNDDINAAIIEPEQDNDRTPIVNRAQHRFEEQIAHGIKTGKLSTLEASSLRRKVAKLEGLEERLKAGKDLSSNERKRLMKEVVELQRDIKKAFRN